MVNWMTWNRRHFVKLIGGLAAVLTIIAFVDTYFLGGGLIRVLHRSISIPLWVIFVMVLGTTTVFIRLSALIRSRLNPVIVPETAIHEITSKRKVSVVPISSEFISSPQGTFSVWVYIQPFGNGIRELENNRYIFAHATNNGRPKDINGKRRYVNVIAFCRGPRKWSPPREPAWRLFLANAEGEKKSWFFNDSEALKSGWHHFLFRWDHDRLSLELLLDSEIIIRADQDYRKFWPNHHDNQAFIGSWPTFNRIHFIETRIARVQYSRTYMTDNEVKVELHHTPMA